ncbi:hypothetical protein [Gloeothece verrucosa]|uniref:Dynamin family protein n=1 Tax=Gloeothece verrucosa (strain PCC 7822) TaxID=497965 RepID=E0UBG0_GLOV7|nr:hypothetical protein [Gloeothece verrucosa]ADN12792.1 hypothetical protein Cyan7822_0766 [Gloeothece verrucosa PCC 7822]
MDEYLNLLQSINQSLEEVLQNPQNSIEAKQVANHLSNSIQPCIDEVFQSATRIKNLVEVCLKELKYAEDIWQNYLKSSKEVSPSVPLEEIGKLSGQSSKILRLLEESRQQVFIELKQFWEQDFESQTQQWFIDKEGKIKKGIGWNEKDSFVKEIKIIYKNQNEQFKELIQKHFNLIFYEIDAGVDFKNINYYVKIIDHDFKEKYQKKIDIIWTKIQESFCLLDNNGIEELFKLEMNRILEPIINSKWGDIPWETAIKVQSEYANKLEIIINNIFHNKAKLITIFFEIIIKAYNDFLQKQAFYKQQSVEEQQEKQAWINTQRQKLETLQQSLENVANFQL